MLQKTSNRSLRRLPAGAPILVLAAALSLACSSGSQTGGASGAGSGAQSGSGSALNFAGQSAAGASNGTGGSAGSVVNPTGGHANAGGTAGVGTRMGTTQCNDGIDNDADGLVDGMDPECTGPADNDEASYATGIPGDNRDPKWQDCFFDGNSGAGDDHCRYSTDCLTGALPSTDPNCQVSAACVAFCRKLTPNGCDCFGCCTVQLENGSSLDVTLSSSCSLANATDPQACPRCTKATNCSNDCGECELCAGKTLADLPAKCAPPPPSDAGVPPPSYTCDNGETVCGPGLSCSNTEFCSFGCCLAVVP